MFLCCGDALYDLFVDVERSNNAKFDVELAGGIGGSPLNVALGLARLGETSAYFTRLSQDLFGQRIRAFMQANDIDDRHAPTCELNSTLAIVETDAQGAPRYVFYTQNTSDVTIRPQDLPSALPDDVRVVHFGSYTTAVEPTGSSLLELARREAPRRLISYDPNVRLPIEPDQQRWRRVFAGYASQADLIKASDEDITTLFGSDAENAFRTACFEAGASLVCITRGNDGASMYSAEREANCPARTVEVVDTVGAGDTFQAAVLHWLARHNHIAANGSLTGDMDLEGMLEFAVQAAAITCTRRGADLPRLHEIAP